MLTSEFPVFFKDKKAKSYRIIFVYALNSKLKCHTSIKKKEKNKIKSNSQRSSSFNSRTEQFHNMVAHINGTLLSTSKVIYEAAVS